MVVGRYAQADPLGLVDGASVYGYSRQNPSMYSDPTGECPWCAYAAAAAAGAAIGAAVDLLIQLAINGGQIECIDWFQVGVGAGLGAVGGVGGFALTGYKQASFSGLRGIAGKAGGQRAAGVKPEWSHAAPERWFKNASPGIKRFVGSRTNKTTFYRLNGNHVPARFHAWTDHWRRWKGVKNAEDTVSLPLRIPLRLPAWMYGAGVGGALQREGCECKE